MSTTHTSNALSSSFAKFLDALHTSLLVEDFKIVFDGFTKNGYSSYTFVLGNFTLSFSLNYNYSSIVHFPHMSTVDLSPFVDVFSFALFSSILENRQHLSL